VHWLPRQCNFSALRWQNGCACASHCAGPEDRVANGSDVDANRITSAAMRGDIEAIQSLWQEHRRWIAAVLLAYKPQSEDVEDLLQEVAMTLVSKVNTLRAESNVRAWLRAVAINVARAAGRSERSRPMQRLGDAEANCPATSANRAFELDDHAARVLSLAAQLPEAYREPLMLKAVQGMRTRQIAELMGIPEATVDTRVSRARRMLREQSRFQHAFSPGENHRKAARDHSSAHDRPDRAAVMPIEVNNG
jgi:RNA polymerase sigma-70 factor (ECF subfamily)